MPQFDAQSNFVRIIEGHSISVSQWVPTHFRCLLLDVPAEERRQYAILAPDMWMQRLRVHREKYAVIEWGPILSEYYVARRV